MFCYVASEVLVLEVKFPPGYTLDERLIEPVAEYVPAPLKGVRDEDFDFKGMKLHDHESARARQSLQQSEHWLRLTIHKPIPGFLYKIRWVPKEQDSHASTPTLQDEVRVALRQKELLAIAAEATAGGDRATYDRVAAPLRELAANISTLRDLPDRLNVSVMIFRQEDARLCTVSANYGDIGQLAKETLAPGEGCAGYVFEKMRPLLHHSSRDTIGYFIRPDELSAPEAERVNLAVLLCFPWVTAGIVVGVVNVSTQTEDSGLLALFDLPKAEQEQAVDTIQALVNLATEKLYNNGRG